MTDTRQTRGGGDPDEMRRAQRGDRSAFLHLYERHAPLTWRLALVAGRDRTAAEAAVVAAFAQVLGRSDRRDSHRFASVDGQLLCAARERAVEQADRIAEPAGLEALVGEAPEDTVRAFDRLPERWRSVLWLHHVERCALGTTALALDCPEPTTSGLATRALGGFREQLVQLMVDPDLRTDCRQTTLRLSGYAACALPSRDTFRVRRHLDRCEACRQRLDELDDVTTHLRGGLPGLPIALESLAMGAWLARAHEDAGPIGLRLPGGSLAPAWVERSLAGATAAVVSLGISAAVLLHARDGGNPVPTESAAARGDGEQALTGDVSTDGEDTSGPTSVISLPPSLSGDDLLGASARGSYGSPSSTTSSSADPTTGSAPAGATPRGGPAPSSPTAPSGPSPTPTPTPTPTPPPPPSGPSDSSSDPVAEVVEVVDDVVDEVCGGLGAVCDALPTQPSLPQIPGL